ncbi:MAG: iron-sulfur cluster carrier protein ApbC [Halofilum sp. (in: g-proteobacteria)]|nr:iron-sulfur cluster carrier protein ApbC [Halofilum sp. (in: g-proteobacteria)]
MSEPDRKRIEAAIAGFTDPDLERDYVEAGCVQSIDIDGDSVRVEIRLPFPMATVREARVAALREQIEAVEGVARADVRLDWGVDAGEVQTDAQRIEGIKNIIAVASAKGGVGKSTTAANLALGLRAEGASVGVLDADIYGPSQPRMLGIDGKPESPDGKTLMPMENHGVKAMSIGFLVDPESPMIWRGPMVTQALEQLLYSTKWGELDYLVVDLPPGTGDIQLTLAQKVPLSGAVIVTTPQDIALLDARKGLKMFEKVDVPVLGIVENMSIHVCSNCGHAEPIFGEGGGERMAQDYGVRLLGQLPLELAIRTQADSGQPTVVADPDSRSAVTYREIARRAAAGHARKDVLPKGFPSIRFTDD